MQLPDILKFTREKNFRLNYKWDKNTSEFMVLEAINDRLLDLVSKLNHKATVALATATAEWCLWQLKDVTSTEDTFKFVEALWTGQIDKHYLKEIEIDSRVNRDLFEGPIWATKEILYSIGRCYRLGKYTIHQDVIGIATLVQHITPQKELFEKWLANCLEKLIKLFPAQYDIKYVLNNVKEFRERPYDSSTEAFIPRELLFETDFNYNTFDKTPYIQTLLKNTDYKNNHYLNSPQEMTESGFLGIPYQYSSSS